MLPKEEPIIVTEPHQKPKIRAEVEPPTSNMTLYGVSKDPANPPPRWPKSYAAKDWVSVTKTDFPKVSNPDRITKDLQIERANFMRTSAVPIGDPSQPPSRVTQSISYEPYERERYTEKVCYPIGGKYNKVRSDVDLTDVCQDERMYEPMSMRQFQPLVIDRQQAKEFAELQTKNKADMQKSHFSVGRDSVDYRTVAKHELPTAAPLIKNRPPSAVDPQRNPHVARTAADARPKKLSSQEVSEDKLRSSVPITNNEPVLKVTTTAASLPAFCPKRQGIVTSTNTQLSTLSFGTDAPVYKPATATQFRGIFFRPGGSQSAGGSPHGSSVRH
jgi:hypothetical protein